MQTTTSIAFAYGGGGRDGARLHVREQPQEHRQLPSSPTSRQPATFHPEPDGNNAAIKQALGADSGYAGVIVGRSCRRR